MFKKKKKDEEDYFAIELDVEKVMESGMLSEMFYLQDLKQRKLILNSDIDQDTIGEYVKLILQYNREDRGIPVESRRPIMLYITSRGGDVEAGFALIDVIRASRTPVYTINTGFQYSMGFLIGLAGHKRYATKNAKFLMHDGSNFIYNSGAKARDQMEFQNRMEERIKEYVISLSSVTADEYDDKFRVEWYMFADEAKQYGITDYIVGEDCDIEEIS